jgi:hypothetical protein
MKVFTKRIHTATQYALAEDYNQEARNLQDSFNGGIGGEQLPFAGFSEDKFSQGDDYDGVVATTPAGATGGAGQRLPTQTYAITQSDITDLEGFEPAGGLTHGILGPAAKTYATNSSDWQPGWNRLSEYIDDGVYLQMPVGLGTLKGAAIVDFEFYLGDASAYGLASALAGGNWRHQIGVFVNGVLVARSGKMPCRRHSYCLPFAIPVSAGTVTVDVRWEADYDGAGVGNDYSWVSDTALRVYNTTLWVRNQTR